ncbi:MAG: hypothetical protein LBL66_04620 [Clostridiales bacterium]|nr:hypothetical protein [Clostridiales bacterium]
MAKFTKASGIATGFCGNSNGRGQRVRNKSTEQRKARGVPLFGRDCRVALRAPRNDTRGVRALRNDPVFISLQL